jgi:transcriptional regulator with XRE-family HTH domain
MLNLQKVRDLAKDKNIQLSEIAEKLDMTPQALSRMLKENSTKVSTLEQFASIFGVSVSYFFDEDTIGNESARPSERPHNVVIPQSVLDMLVEKDNVQYLYRADGSYWLYYVKPDYAGDTVVVPEGVTTIGGSSFAYCTNVKTVVFSSTVRTVRTNAFKNSPVEKVVLNEGLEQLVTPERAFNQAVNIKSVNFPSTLKNIGKQAFMMIAVDELTLPATVETLGEGAFREMPNVKTITIEGNTVIGEFAFRGCADLETVYLNGDDVTFLGTSQAFSNLKTGDSNKITIYVKNQTVADRLEVAQGSAYGYTVVVLP